MLDALRPRAMGLLEMPGTEAARQQGSPGMVFSDFEASAAAELLGPLAHEETAAALAPLISDYLD